MLGKLIIEGIVLGILLFVYCLIGIRNGAVGMVFLYSDEVKKRCVERGMTTWETIRKRAAVYRLSGAVIYIAYTLVCVYAINKMRGFWEGFAGIFAIMSILNLVDRLLVDEWWVGHTKTWIIPETEDLMPYITRRDKIKKWLTGTAGFAVLSMILSGIMLLFIR